MLAPNAPLRSAVTTYAGLPMDTPGGSLQAQAATPPKPATGEPTPTRPARDLWAARIARIYAVLPLICPECGDEMRPIAFITEAEPLRRILAHLDEPVKPPTISPARSPPEPAVIDGDSTAANDPERVDPVPEFDKSSGETICSAK